MSFCIYDNISLDYQLISFFWPPQGTDTTTEHQSGDHKSPHCCYYPINCWLLLFYTYLCKRNMCLSFYFLSNPRIFPILLSSTSLIYHLQILCNLLMPCLLIVMYKAKCRTHILWSIFSVHWDIVSQQLSPVWLTKILYRFECFLCWHLCICINFWQW